MIFPYHLFRVYPRVGGGTKRNDTPGIDLAGLSPRGRGNQEFHRLVRLWIRSIPAWAGEPRSVADGLCLNRVYPRVGGGT